MAPGSVRPVAGLRGAPSAMPVRAGRGPWRAARRRTRLPFAALGGLLVVVCVLGYAFGAIRLGDRVQVLAVARPMVAGQTFAAADLRTVSAARDATLTLIAASQLERVIGRTAVVPLLPGTVLTSAVVGDADFPPVGKVVASVAVKPGQYPQGLVIGAHVLAYVVSNTSAGAPPSPTSTNPQAAGGAMTTSRPIPAVVLGVDLAGDGQGATVVSLLLDSADAGRFASAGSGSVVLVQTSPGGS